MLLIVMMLVACSGDPVDEAVSPCVDEERAEVLSAGASFDGLTITDADPLPAYAGENTWELSLDAGEGCTLTAQTRMPDHGHGGPAPSLEDLGGGDYRAEIEFTMGGYWEITVQVDCPEADEVVIPVAVCVES
jgi:hypothetical protein